MKTAISRFVMAAALAALVVLGGSANAWAACSTSPNYTGDFSSEATTPCLTLNPTSGTTPVFVAGVSTSKIVLRLTKNTANQVGSAWFTAPQPVAGSFSTTFQFQISGGTGSLSPADGFAFVIQNSALTALGPAGCGIGYGYNTCTGGDGILNSLAVEFDTFNNNLGDHTQSSHVGVQSCGTAQNSSDNDDPLGTGTCKIKANYSLPVNLSDGATHFATISYDGAGNLSVSVDSHDLFPGGVPVNLGTFLSLASGNAFVGFTAATGGGNDNQDILTWTFSPQAQSTVVTTAALSSLPFQNAAAQTNVYSYTAQLTSGSGVQFKVKPILISQSDCNALVQKNFWPAHCFVYENAADSGIASSVLFEVTCPQSPGGTCGSSSNPNFLAELGTEFQFASNDNPAFTYPGIFGLLNPFPGWLKGDHSPDPLQPCLPPASGSMFQSNQVDTFFIDGGHTTGKSGGGGSCWVATYDTPGELLPGIKITAPTFLQTFAKASTALATYTCKDPITSKAAGNPTGPYLTVASCKQSFLPSASTTNACITSPGQQACSGLLDTSTVGLHTLLVTAVDSGGNTNVNAVTYKVK